MENEKHASLPPEMDASLEGIYGQVRHTAIVVADVDRRLTGIDDHVVALEGHVVELRTAVLRIRGVSPALQIALLVAGSVLGGAAVQFVSVYFFRLAMVASP